MVKHYFSVEVAKEAGINAAIVMENIAFWINHNKKAGRNKHDGTYWMFSTQKDLAENFQYMSVKQVRTAIEKLVKLNYLKTGNYNKIAYDKTLWYALSEKGETILYSGQNVLPLRAKGADTEGEPIPDIVPDRKKQIDKRKIEHIRKICGIV